MSSAVTKRKPKAKAAARPKAKPKAAPGAKRTAKSQLYAELVTQLRSLLKDEYDFIANAANFSALLYHALPDVNWAGFYFLHDQQLVLGPFQGKPACVRIPVGKGVCGVAAARAAAVLVPDVHQFPGHIACDPTSRSELVVPLIEAGTVSGVLDLDSPLTARFDEDDRIGCQWLVAVIVDHHRRHLDTLRDGTLW